MFGNNNRLQIKPQQQPTVDLYRAPSGIVYQHVRPSLKKRLFKAAMLLALMGGLLGGIWYVVFGTAIDCEASTYNCLKH